MNAHQRRIYKRIARKLSKPARSRNAFAIAGRVTISIGGVEIGGLSLQKGAPPPRRDHEWPLKHSLTINLSEKSSVDLHAFFDAHLGVPYVAPDATAEPNLMTELLTELERQAFVDPPLPTHFHGISTRIFPK